MSHRISTDSAQFVPRLCLLQSDYTWNTSKTENNFFYSGLLQHKNDDDDDDLENNLTIRASLAFRDGLFLLKGPKGPSLHQVTDYLAQGPKGSFPAPRDGLFLLKGPNGPYVS